jgi:hypothetical protein
VFLLIPAVKTFRKILENITFSSSINVGKVEELINPDAPRLVPTPERTAANNTGKQKARKIVLIEK